MAKSTNEKQARYLLAVMGCVEITRHGPYRTEKALWQAAQRLHRKLSDEDSLFWLEVDFDGRRLEVGGFANSYWEESGS